MTDETLEEAAERISKEHYVDQSDYWAVGVDSFKRGAKWQAEQDKNKYSEEDLREAILTSFLLGVDRGNYSKELEDKLIEQFKKKQDGH